MKIQEKREGEGAEKLFEEVLAKNVSCQMKDMNTNMQEAQQTPSRRIQRDPQC